MSYFAIFAHLHLLQEILRIEILHNATVQPFFDSRSKSRHFPFPILQQTEAGTDHLAGVVITPARDGGLNEFFEVLAERNGCCFHKQLCVYITKLPIFHNFPSRPAKKNNGTPEGAPLPCLLEDLSNQVIDLFLKLHQNGKNDEYFCHEDAVGQAGAEVGQPGGEAGFGEMLSNRKEDQVGEGRDEGEADETVQMEVEGLVRQAQFRGDVVLRFERTGCRFPSPVDLAFVLVDELVSAGTAECHVVARTVLRLFFVKVDLIDELSGFAFPEAIEEPVDALEGPAFPGHFVQPLFLFVKINEPVDGN